MPTMKLLFVALLFVASAALAASSEEIIRLPSGEGAVLPYLLSTDGDREYTLAAILFNGGYGEVGLLSRCSPSPGANFLVRSRQLFVDRGVATAVIDVPSDNRMMSDSFRMSRRHMDDVAAVLRDLRARLPQAKIFLVGTSRGTVSAAYAGAALGGEVAGVVLSSSMFNAPRDGAGLAGFDYARIAAPLLFVHHAADDCRYTPYAAAASLGQRYALITVHGGKPPRSGPCDPFHAHGYFGKEAETVEAISAWMAGRPYAKVIE